MLELHTLTLSLILVLLKITFNLLDFIIAVVRALHCVRSSFVSSKDPRSLHLFHLSSPSLSSNCNCQFKIESLIETHNQGKFDPYFFTLIPDFPCILTCFS